MFERPYFVHEVGVFLHATRRRTVTDEGGVADHALDPVDALFCWFTGDVDFGCLVRMGTGFDNFTARAHAYATDGVSHRAQANRHLLRTAMAAGGISVYSGEWWHFDGPGAGTPRPILRAGLGMLDGMVRLLPTAEVGFLGMIRNEETLKASTYASRMPEDLSGRQVYVLDPMLATGGTLVAAIEELMRRGADDVTAVVLLAAPEGVEVMERELAGKPVTVVTAAVDDHLNGHGYIVPGLGDAGDRLYGLAD